MCIEFGIELGFRFNNYTKFFSTSIHTVIILFVIKKVFRKVLQTEYFPPNHNLHIGSLIFGIFVRYLFFYKDRGLRFS